MNSWMKKALALAGALVLWQLVATSGWVPSDHFPPVTQVLAAGRDMIRSGELPMAEGQTLVRALAGLAVTVCAGVLLALLAARHEVVARMCSPVVEIMRSIPPAALVPLAIFALGLTPKLFIGIVVYAGFSTVYLTTLHALLNVEPIQINAARTLGYGRLETLLRVRLPAATPAMFTGIRVAAASALIASVASEMLAGKDGLGYLLFDTAFSLRTPEMFAVMFVAALNGILLNQLVVWTRHPFASWQDRLHALGGT